MLSRVAVIPVSAGLGLAVLYFLTLQAPQVNRHYDCSDISSHDT